ncbi:FxsA family protein [Solwaraspora sp. WMMD406]|uniref:FxsA family protein n=1 Tax=Solwaraspora sp. WMMD406 TaxID=3016095 RepID=UPI002415B305|nr:FxsA family protein [Solwaraspora sp. WMMD406]MDG4766197.1 FxsA family protein [Solwaraspora sp. WMMD406]MDG4768668.1 FxsA family protein [Solwaraspora sp. WMMD406]
MRRGLKVVPVALAAGLVLEIVVFVLLAQWIGYLWALLLTLVASVAGMVLLRREGTRAWRSFRAAAQAGQPPGEQVSDGLLGLAAGLLLAAPGLVSGAFGTVLAVPPVRRLVRRRIQVAAERRLSSAAAGDMFGPRRVRVYPGTPSGPSPAGAADGPSSPADPGPTVEGEIIDPGRR